MLSQVTDIWLDPSSRDNRLLIVVYRGIMYRMDLYCTLKYTKEENKTIPKRVVEFKRRLTAGIVTKITQHEQEDRFGRRGLNSMYPGLM